MIRLSSLPGLAGLAFGIVLFAEAAAQNHRSAWPAFAARFTEHVAEASRRFEIPEKWIYAVMRQESGGRIRAVSRAGAMGLMQIMPATWATLRKTYGLGRNPFDPRDNILAGTAYLREMHNLFGSPGFLAAYNAGPARYRQYRDKGRPLPRETRAYLAALVPLIGDGKRANLAPPPATGIPSQETAARVETVVRPPIIRDMSGLIPSSNGLFITRATMEITP